MRTWLLIALALAATPFTTVAADPAPEPPPDTAARVEALVRVEPRDDAVQRPLAIARRALDQARDARMRGEADQAARADELARAAVELAEARLRLARERALHEATVRRRRDAEHALARARAEASPVP